MLPPENLLYLSTSNGLANRKRVSSANDVKARAYLHFDILHAFYRHPLVAFVALALFDPGPLLFRLKGRLRVWDMDRMHECNGRGEGESGGRRDTCTSTV